MKAHMRQGWRMTFKHFHFVLLLFVYQLIWGFFLYRIIDNTVAPLLRRFPSASTTDRAVQTYMTEAQFQLFKTDLIDPYLWLIGGLFLARMLLTPLFNAGFFYSLHQQSKDGGNTRFLEGVRKTWKPITLLYWIQAVLLLAPAWWIFPKVLHILLKSDTASEVLTAIVPGALIWMLWGGLLHLLFLAMQFGAVSGDGIIHTLWLSIKRFASYVAISFLMWGIAVLLGLAVTSISMLWAGLFALILHQSYPLIQTLLKVWTIATQYHYLKSER
ncbi:hypothetical protein I6N90_18650 [Paenibacillus sp. GSMTC-2017]|uniref:hypothetical protein n=1 Tax=Paenibacillus sp. GSMTC-2017 TaxID=2794350 RepID=UPI0018D7C466|nr:hypothetical protein [Paenibacillus sp. GSMTC-2017]MBH5319823.1 hypothetical protein [Paenibacillus sp. GSMTC-2017]